MKTAFLTFLIEPSWALAFPWVYLTGGLAFDMMDLFFVFAGDACAVCFLFFFCFGSC
jgi:hypothetical protein